MSRIKMLLDVVRDLHNLTDSLETLAHAMGGKDEEQTKIGEKAKKLMAVSYTHLTLPTILRV